MKKILLKKITYAMLMAMVIPSTMVAMERSGAGTPIAAASNASMSSITPPWGESTNRIETLDTRISDLETQINTAKTAFLSGDQAVQRALRDVASPPRGRGIAEPAEAKKGFLGGFSDAAMEGLRSWALYLTNSKQYWKSQHTTIVSQYDQRIALATQIFGLEAELAQVLKEREGLKVFYLKEHYAMILGKLEGRNLTIRQVARTAGFEVSSSASLSSIDRDALARQIKQNKAAQGSGASPVAEDEF
jgi:hypothetical protein